MNAVRTKKDATREHQVDEDWPLVRVSIWKKGEGPVYAVAIHGHVDDAAGTVWPIFEGAATECEAVKQRVLEAVRTAGDKRTATFAQWMQGIAAAIESAAK